MRKKVGMAVHMADTNAGIKARSLGLYRQKGSNEVQNVCRINVCDCCVA